MPRGGARTGAGRKPKPRKERRLPANVVVIDGGRVNEIAKTPPADLPEDQQDFWKRNAPIAIEAGTLTTQTEAAFRLLCELNAEKTATKRTLDHDGRTYQKAFCDSSGQEHLELKAHPLTSSYRQLAQRVEALMARFLLAPFGKPLEAHRKKTGQTANPWMAITAAKVNGRT